MSDLVDGNGEVQMYHSYEPDGQTTLRFRGYIKNPYRYNAERVDYVPGIADFQYLRARYYRPDLARFITQDTVWGNINVPLTQNLYAYVGNNPINRIDPSGMSWEEFWGWLTGLFGGKKDNNNSSSSSSSSGSSSSSNYQREEAMRKAQEEEAHRRQLQAKQKDLTNKLDNIFNEYKNAGEHGYKKDWSSKVAEAEKLTKELRDTCGVEYNQSFIVSPHTFEEALVKQLGLKGNSRPIDTARGMSAIAYDWQVEHYMNPFIFMNDSSGIYQFSTDFGVSGLSAGDIDEILSGHKLLSGMGSTFIEAEKQSGLNAIYLYTHSKTELGEESLLWPTVMSDGTKVYNAYGIGAVDGDPIGGGSKTALLNGWTSPELAIIGGAVWVSERYESQQTPYEKRWNPTNPAQSQYATAIQWAKTQAQIANQSSDIYVNSDLHFRYPVYKAP